MSQFEKNTSPDYYRLYPRPNLVLLYKEPRSNYNRRMNLKPKTTSTSNTLSRNSAMKMKRALNWLVASATFKSVFEKKYGKKVPWRVNMITLTLPTQSDTTDSKCKRMLNEFVKWAGYNWGLRNYVWRAEPQARGEIHFHMITDCYMDYKKVCFAWNRILKNYGLLNGHVNPNSTDIHAVIEQHVRNLKAYVVDYMMEKKSNDDGTERRDIKGRLWGCSKALSKAGKQFQLLDESEAEIVHKSFVTADWDIKQIEGTSCYIYMARRNQNPYKLINPEDDIAKMYQAELKAIRSTQVQLAMFERESAMVPT